MKKLLSIVLVVVVAMGTMVFAFADTGVEEVVADEAVAFECPYGEEQGQRIMNRYADGSGEGMKGNGLRDGSGIEEGRGQGNGHYGAQDGSGNGDRLRAGTEDCVNAE
jgi:hypothetical protein